MKDKPAVEDALLEDEKKYKAAVTMLGEMTQNGYKRVSDAVAKAYSIPKEWIPSFYKLTKNRPNVVSNSLVPTYDTFVTREPLEENAHGLVLQMEDVGLYVD